MVLGIELRLTVYKAIKHLPCYTTPPPLLLDFLLPLTRPVTCMSSLSMFLDQSCSPLDVLMFLSTCLVTHPFLSLRVLRVEGAHLKPSKPGLCLRLHRCVTENWLDCKRDTVASPTVHIYMNSVALGAGEWEQGARKPKFPEIPQAVFRMLLNVIAHGKRNQMGLCGLLHKALIPRPPKVLERTTLNIRTTTKYVGELGVFIGGFSIWLCVWDKLAPESLISWCPISTPNCLWSLWMCSTKWPFWSWKSFPKCWEFLWGSWSLVALWHLLSRNTSLTSTMMHTVPWH